MLTNGSRCTLSEKAFQQLQLILPYWGLSISENAQIERLLRGKTLNMSLSDTLLKAELIERLKHTNLELNFNPEDSADISVQTTNEPQIILKTNNMTYHLEFETQQTGNTQKDIHKQLWVPISKSPITVEINEDLSPKVQSEILSYIIIQFLCQKDFESISHIPFPDYQHLVKKVLKPINQAFAYQQGNMEEETVDDWPEPPSELFYKKENKSLQPEPHVIDKEEEPASPLISARPTLKTKRQAINPFKKSIEVNESNGSIFNPFKKK